MDIRPYLLAAGLALVPPAFAQEAAAAPQADGSTNAAALSADQVRAMLMRQGYTDVREIELDDGRWEVEARDADGDWSELHLDARTGQAIADGDTSGLTADQIRSGLEAKGYSGFTTLKFDDGQWKAHAVNAANQPVELEIDARSGLVTKEEADD